MIKFEVSSSAQHMDDPLNANSMLTIAIAEAVDLIILLEGVCWRGDRCVLFEGILDVDFLGMFTGLQTPDLLRCRVGAWVFDWRSYLSKKCSGLVVRGKALAMSRWRFVEPCAGRGCPSR